MAKVKLNALIVGGKATAGPPLGPALGPLGVNVGQIIAEINNKTKDFMGMNVPVTLEIDPATKKFEVAVGSPPVSALLKKEAGVEKGAKTAWKEPAVADITMDQVKKVVDAKKKFMLGRDEKALTKEVLGVAHSLGMTVGGKPAKEVSRSL